MQTTVERVIEKARQGEAIDQIFAGLPITDIRRIYELLPKECKERYANLANMAIIYGTDLRTMVNADFRFDPSSTYDYQKDSSIEIDLAAGEMSVMDYIDIARNNIWTGEFCLCVLLHKLVSGKEITSLEARPIVESIRSSLKKSIYPLNSAWQALADKVRSSSHLDKVIASILEVVASPIRVFPYTEERVLLRQQFMDLYLEGILSQQEVVFCTLLHEAQCIRSASRIDLLRVAPEDDFLNACAKLEEESRNLYGDLLPTLIASSTLVALMPYESKGLYSWVDSGLRPLARKGLLCSSFPRAFVNG